MLSNSLPHVSVCFPTTLSFVAPLETKAASIAVSGEVGPVTHSVARAVVAAELRPKTMSGGRRVAARVAAGGRLILSLLPLVAGRWRRPQKKGHRGVCEARAGSAARGSACSPGWCTPASAAAAQRERAEASGIGRERAPCLGREGGIFARTNAVGPIFRLPWTTRRCYFLNTTVVHIRYFSPAEHIDMPRDTRPCISGTPSPLERMAGTAAPPTAPPDRSGVVGPSNKHIWPIPPP